MDGSYETEDFVNVHSQTKITVISSNFFAYHNPFPQSGKGDEAGICNSLSPRLRRLVHAA